MVKIKAIKMNKLKARPISYEQASMEEAKEIITKASIKNAEALSRLEK